MSQIEEFNKTRSLLNEKVMAADNKVIKRIYGVDTLAYTEGALNEQTKEAIGLACSLVLRCDDCVKYHLGKAKEAGMTYDQIVEAMSISLLIGGTIVIPHLRRAMSYLEELEELHKNPTA